MTQELFALEQVEDFEAEQLLGSDSIDIRNREPLTFLIPKPTRGEAVRVRMRIQNIPERLRHRDDTGAGFVVADGFDHQLFDGLVSEAGEIPEKLSVVHEIGS